jgi:CRP-like cAMP-binding protein
VLDNIRVFDDVDRAIEWAEDVLLREALYGEGDEMEIALEPVGVLRAFDPADIATIRPYVRRTVYKQGGIIFSEGDPGKELFIIVRGTASAWLRQTGKNDIRLATFGPGTVFGELAILDAGPRSATVSADSDLTCYGLSGSDFAVLSAGSPRVAIKLLAALGRELSGRLRRANRTIQELET